MTDVEARLRHPAGRRGSPERLGIRRPRRALDDRSAVVLAAAACSGAWVAHPGVGWLGVIMAAVAWLVGRPWMLVAGVALVTSGLAAHATAGLVIDPGTWHGPVEVLHVTTTRTGDLHVEVRAEGRHLDLVPPDQARRSMLRAHPGDRLDVTGRVVPGDPLVARSRGTHIAGRLYPEHLAPGGRPRLMWRLAGTVRGAVVALGRPLSSAHQALFEGFVLGDASGQTAVQRADFRASGLTHLLVASGENVAFVLLLAAPVLLRSGLRTRWMLTIGLCLLYALVTGLEPSVLRAATMAVVATTAAGLGRPARSWRTLAYAVTALVIADPFLVHSSAFGLSVGASAGILALARPLVGVLPGPLWLRRPLAVTVAAQLGVAPLLLGFPGGMPVAAVPANLLAAVPAGGVMVLGLPALVLVATGLPGSGSFVWVPRILLGFIDAVARDTASLDLGYLGGVTVLATAVGVVTVLAVGRNRLAWVRRVGYLVAGIGLGAPLLSGPPGPGVGAAAGPVVLRRGGTVVVVLTGEEPAEALLTDLSVARVRRVDVVVVPHGNAADLAMVETMGHRHRIGRIITPDALPPSRWPQTVVTAHERVGIDGAVVDVVATDPVLSVHVTDRGRRR